MKFAIEVGVDGVGGSNATAAEDNQLGVVELSWAAGWEIGAQGVRPSPGVVHLVVVGSDGGNVVARA